MFFGAIINGIVFLNSVLNHSLLVYRSTAKFGLCYYVWAFSFTASRGLLFLVCASFFLLWLLLLQSVDLEHLGLSSCGTQD